MQDPLKIALHYLKFRPRTIFEIEQKLKSKRIEGKEIKKTIALLKKNKLLDDKNFAEMWAKDRNLLKPEGSYLLKLELKKLGIADSIIEKVLESQDEAECAKKALEAKSRFFSRFEGEEKRIKMFSFLKRRGFSYSIAKKAIEEYKKAGE